MESKGNVVIVGVLDVPGSTNLYMAKAFEKKGYTVIPVNYRTILAQAGANTLKSVLWRIAQDKPKLMLFSKFNGMDSAIIGKSCQHTKTWFWFMDGINTLNSVRECIVHAQMADYTSCTGLGVLDYIKQQIGIDEQMYHIMEGIDPDVYRPVNVKADQFACDVAFIGTATPLRLHLVNTLINAGLGVNVYGHGWNKTSAEIHSSQFNLACAGANIMLASSAEHDTQEYFSDRIFRYGACGSFVLHQYAPGLDKYFQHGIDLMYFHNEETLVKTAVEYAQDNKVRERQAMAQSLYDKVVREHTWDAVVDKICTTAEI